MFGCAPGSAFQSCSGFKPFWPLALVRHALVAIIFQALRRFRGAVLFRSLRPSSSWGFPFWRLGLTVQSSRPAFGGRLTLAVSPFIFPLYAGQHLFQRSANLKGFSFGVLALRRASPVCTAQVSSLFGLQRLCRKRRQLSFLQRCAASVAQRFFMGRVRLQGWAPPFGLRV